MRGRSGENPSAQGQNPLRESGGPSAGDLPKISPVNFVPSPSRWLTLALFSAAPLLSAADLATLDGKVFKDYTVTKVEPDGLSIRHAEGMAKIPFHRLPEEMQKEHGYDPFHAYDYDQDEERKRRETEAQKDALVREQREALEKQLKAEQFAKAVTAAAKRVQLKLDKGNAELTNGIAGSHEALVRTAVPENGKIERGVTCTILVGEIGAIPVMKGKIKAGETKGWIFPPSGSSAYLDVTELIAKRQIRIGSAGSGRLTDCEFEGVVWQTGQIEIVDLEGDKITLPCYTASRQEAESFYRQHGLPAKSHKLVADWQGTIKAGQ